MRLTFNESTIRITVFAVATFILIFGILYYMSTFKPNSDPDVMAVNTDNASVQAADVEQLEVETITEGSGSEAHEGQTLVVNYRGSLLDGTEFDNSYDRGQPFEFELGTPNIIQGWNDGLRGAKAGEKRKLTIPSSLGYGAAGSPPSIPSNAGLIFEIEVLEIK